MNIWNKTAGGPNKSLPYSSKHEVTCLPGFSYKRICKFCRKRSSTWGQKEIEKVEEPDEQFEHVYQRKATKA